MTESGHVTVGAAGGDHCKPQPLGRDQPVILTRGRVRWQVVAGRHPRGRLLIVGNDRPSHKGYTHDRA